MSLILEALKRSDAERQRVQPRSLPEAPAAGPAGSGPGRAVIGVPALAVIAGLVFAGLRLVEHDAGADAPLSPNERPAAASTTEARDDTASVAPTAASDGIEAGPASSPRQPEPELRPDARGKADPRPGADSGAVSSPEPRPEPSPEPRPAVNDAAEATAAAPASGTGETGAEGENATPSGAPAATARPEDEGGAPRTADARATPTGSAAVRPATPSERDSTPPAPPIRVDLPPRQARAVTASPAASASSGRDGAGAASRPLPALSQLPQDTRAAIGELTINIHVYDPQPAARFVLLDLKRYREGDAISDDLAVVEIRPDSIVLAYRGQRFLLPAQGG